MKAKFSTEHVVFHSAEALRREIKALIEAEKWFEKPAYFRLAHYLNIRNRQIIILNDLKKDFGLLFRKTSDAKILRILPKQNA